MRDQEILKLFRENELKRGIKAVYSSFPSIQKMVLTNSGTKEDAEDLFQEVLLVLIEKTKDENFELKSSLSTFLYAIARNLWLKALRKRGSKASLELDENLASEETDLGLAEEKQTWAEAALEQLGEKCRELLVLFYYHRLSFESIAKKLGFRNDKVAKNQKYRCLEKAKANYSLLSTH
ncbi:MAG: RNA polymerase sigma factor [Bacteroidia bacterium]